MATVYLANDRNLGTNVVIKVPRLTLLEESDFAQRFDHEIRALVQLAHPHVCRVLDLGVQDGMPFAVLQYLPGGTLEDQQVQGPSGRPKAAPPAQLHIWLKAIAEALDFIHQRDYVHRDVKPSNIMFDEHGYAYLGDFGVAKVVAENEQKGSKTALTGTGVALGTPQYMAPELIMGEPVDGRIDQYALAVTVFEILSGRYPFEGASPTAILVAASTQKSPSLLDLNLGLAPALAHAVSKGLARNSKERFRSCGAFADAVLATVNDRPKGPFVPASASQTTQTSSKTGGGDSASSPKIHICPNCGTKFRLKAASLAARAKCPACRQVVLLDAPGTQIEGLQASPDETATMGAFVTVERKVSPPARPRFLELFRSTMGTRGSSSVRQATARNSESNQRLTSTRVRTQILIGAFALVLLVTGGIFFLLKGGKSGRTSASAVAAEVSSIPPVIAAPRTEAARSPNHPTESNPNRSSESFQPALSSSPAIYTVRFEPPTTQLSIRGGAASISGLGSNRNIVVKDPKLETSITLIATAEGFQEQRRELAPRPGLSETIVLKLQPNGERGAKAGGGGAVRVRDMHSSKSVLADSTSESLTAVTPKPATKAPAEASDKFAGTHAGQVRADNDLNIEFVWIPAGEFKMGSEEGPDHRSNEGPVEVKLTRGYWLAKYELTQAQWQRAMQSSPWRKLTDDLHLVDGDNYPATHVDWNGAMSFCAKLTQEEHKAGRLPANWEYTLPTEAQWEYACRAGTMTRFSSGKNISNLLDSAWFKGNLQKDFEQHAQNVGLRAPNPWGLYDMHGNASEWCRDSYSPALPGGTDPEATATGKTRVLRGGSWRSHEDDLRSASRNSRTVEARSSVVGFRVAAVPTRRQVSE
jgi:formylglycine-generating enzyme required for sulfatase activity/serine/threonine protein kinase